MNDTERNDPRPPRVAIEPEPHRRSVIAAAVEAGGGIVCDLSDADALVWTAWNDPDGLRAALARAPRVEWVQLATAGIDAILPAIDADRVWTCAKGAFSDPIAEHALALLLAGLRNVHHYARADSYTAPSGSNLLGSKVTVVGGGGIARSFIRLLGPFGAEVTVVRRSPVPIHGAATVVDPSGLDEAVRGSRAVVLALALTPETEGIIGRHQLAAMGSACWLVNVARGRHVDTEALVAALRDGIIAGAALDAHDEEPLPDDHPLWRAPNCIVTPHTACTPAMGDALFARRVELNVGRWRDGAPLLGAIDPIGGY